MTAQHKPAALEFDQVTFGYGRLPVLREASLRILQGELVAVVGPNGSGKTTLMRLGLGLLRPTHGSVRLFGTDVARFRERWRVGYVPQRASGTTALPISVTEVVRTGFAGRQRPWRRFTHRYHERLEHVLDLMDLATVRRRRLSELSGGQQQRVLIARALITAPRLLVLDEPTTGVDAEARSVLRSSLEHLVAVEDIAVVYVSHDPHGFAGLTDRVVEVRAGRVVRIDAAATFPTVEAAEAPAEGECAAGVRVDRGPAARAAELDRDAVDASGRV